MSSDRRPAPPPLEGSEQLVTAVLTAAWGAALLVLFLLRDLLPAGARWWLWTCLAGLVMGLFGLWYVPHLKRARSRATGRARREETGGGSG